MKFTESGGLSCSRLERVVDQWAPCWVGPGFIFDANPVLLWVQIFTGKSATAFPLQNHALMRRERSLSGCPWRNVSQVLVTKDMSDFGVAFEVRDHRVGNLLVRGRVFVHVSQSNYIR